jgi:hypothetical protein
MPRKKKDEGYVSPATETLRTLQRLDAALSRAQDVAGSLVTHNSPFVGAKQVASDTWDKLEELRHKIRRTAERRERSGGILG